MKEFCLRVLGTMALLGCSPFVVQDAHSEPSQHVLNVCSYRWSAYGTDWRVRSWQPWNCSNGLPVSGAASVGQAQNDSGTAGQSLCQIDTGRHYNHPSSDGATTGVVRCLFVPPAWAPIQPEPAMTVCSYAFDDEYATGWRWRTWQPSDCSHGLPAASSWGMAQAENGGGTEGMPYCDTTAGAHYNHPYWHGATTGTVRCVFVDPNVQFTNPEATLCQHHWPDYAVDWRSHTWAAADCSHGLPAANAVAIGSSQNGTGAGSMARCGPTYGEHYNHPVQTWPTSGTTRCLYVNPPSPPASAGYAFDLNADGANDANVTFEPCNDGTGKHCLGVDSWLFTTNRKIAVGGTDARATTTNERTAITNSWQDPLRPIGDHTGDGLAEISAQYARELAGGKYAPALAVVDVDAVGAQAILGNATSPPELTTFEGYSLRADNLFPAGPGGRVHPAFTPGYGDGNHVPAEQWGWGCLFRVGESSPDCGQGFLRISTVPGPLPHGTTHWFRESIGHVADIDADGWEDLHLPYHWAFLSISGQTGLQLTTTAYDVAAATGGQPLNFHSGRNYGTHRAVAVGPTLRTVLVAGSPVGDFDSNHFFKCNGPRYTAVLTQTGEPWTRTLAWARFDGFGPNTWPDPLPGLDGGQVPAPSRWGDFVDKCIHRYFDSRTVMDGEEVLLVNYFSADWAHPDNASLAGRCKNEQYALYVAPTWTQEKQDVWNACYSQHARTKGRWGMKVIREGDGAGLTGSLDTYVWGWSAALREGNEIIYLLEWLPNPVRFDIADDSGNRLAPSQLRAWALVNGLWSDRGTFPIAGRPVLVDVPKTGSLGTGDFYPVKSLWLEDADADGSQDVAIATASGVVWVGWSCTLWVGGSCASGFWDAKP